MDRIGLRSVKARYGFDAYRTRESSSIRYIRYDMYRVMYRGESRLGEIIKIVPAISGRSNLAPAGSAGL
jgi:hypothetical protein